MLGYENYKGEDPEPPPYQGGSGGMPGYPFTPHQMNMAAQHWGMMMNAGPGGPQSHPHHHLPPQHSLPPHSFQPIHLSHSMIPPEMSPNGGNIDDISVPSPGESDTSSTGSLRQHQQNRNKVSYSATPVSPPPSRERFSYTRYQLELLNGIYCEIRYPSSMQKQLIAKRVGISREQVKVWFQNRRRKDIIGKKQNDIESNTPKMVPPSILSGVLHELLSYENEPKGKKAQTAQKSYEKKVATRRSRQNSESSVDDVPQAKRQKRSLDDSSDSLPPTKRLHENNYIPVPNLPPQTFNPDSLPVIHFASEPSPGNSIGFDSFSSSHSPFSNASHQDSDTTPVNSANNSLVSSSHSQDSVVSSTALEMALRANFRTISSEELDRPAPPNVIVPGIDPALLQRPRSLESPAAEPYVPTNEATSTTDDGLHIATIHNIHSTPTNEYQLSGNIQADENDLNFHSANLQIVSSHEIQQSNSHTDLNTSKENELHLTTTPDGCLQVTKISSDKDNDDSQENLPDEDIPLKDVAPNKVAPPSGPINFNPRIIATESLKRNLAPVSVAVAEAEAKAREYERVRNSSNNNHINTTSASEIHSITPLYTMNELPHQPEHNNWQKQQEKQLTTVSMPNMLQFDPPMYHPGYSYSGHYHHPGFLPEPPVSNSSTVPTSTSSFDKMMPYMMGCMPGFPAPPDPNFICKNNNNNPAGIFKDVYPPAFLMPSPYGVSPSNMGYPTYEVPTDLSGGKKQYML